jgi:hypothetical protein
MPGGSIGTLTVDCGNDDVAPIPAVRSSSDVSRASTHLGRGGEFTTEPIALGHQREAVAAPPWEEQAGSPLPNDPSRQRTEGA